MTAFDRFDSSDAFSSDPDVGIDVSDASFDVALLGEL